MGSWTRIWVIGTALLGLLACKDKAVTKTDPAALAVAPAGGSAVPDCAPTETEDDNAMRWFHDDFDAAVACAKASERPLVVDLWAPWCHTCLSMQHFVFPDRSFAPLADRFVWLALDTDQPGNATALESLPIAAWPTFYVLDAQSMAIQARYVGSASVRQFREFLTQGETAYLAGRSTETADGSPPGPLALLSAGDRAAAAGNSKEAGEHYQAALAAAPADWVRRPDALVSLIGTLAGQELYPACLDLALASMDSTGKAASAADFLYYGSVCADALKDDPRVATFRSQAVALLEALTGDATAPLSVDDRSDAMRIWREIVLSSGDTTSAKDIASRQRALLDEAAKAAPSAMARMTFNWPRAEVYTFLEVGAELIADLEQSVKDLPLEYDPPYRLAYVLSRLGRPKDALAPAIKAAELAYGPRKARVQTLIADLHLELKDTAAERTAIEATLATYEGLPASQRNARAEEALRTRLGSIPR